MGCFKSKPKRSQSSLSFVKTMSGIKDLKNNYEIGKKLGAGSFGKVFIATNKKDPTIRLAIKKISKKGMKDADLKGLQNEVAIMQHIDHPNIVKYFETYEEPETIYLCMELCEGGELSISKIKEDSGTSFETTSALWLEKIVMALKHCHDQNIIHRDIKPENIMLNKQGKVKIIDFGFAVLKEDKDDKLELAGTPYYIAPEVLTQKGKYGKECDIWSLGVCFMQLLNNDTMPFDGNSLPEVFSKIKKGDFKLPRHRSDKFKDLMKKMLTVQPSKRITADEILKHPWITETNRDYYKC